MSKIIRAITAVFFFVGRFVLCECMGGYGTFKCARDGKVPDGRLL